MPLLLELIQASGLHPLEYFHQYCQRLLTGQLHLLLGYGIALSGNLKTTLLIVDNHQPQALILTELDKILICNNQNYYEPSRPTLALHSTALNASIDEIRQQFIQTNFQNNKCHNNCLSQYYGFLPQKLWQQCKEYIDNQFKELTKDPLMNAELLALQHQRLISAPWQQASLLSMRLQAEKQSHLFMNPLSYG